MVNDPDMNHERIENNPVSGRAPSSAPSGIPKATPSLERQPPFGLPPVPRRRNWWAIGGAGASVIAVIAWGLLRGAGPGSSALFATSATAAAGRKPGLLVPSSARVPAPSRGQEGFGNLTSNYLPAAQPPAASPAEVPNSGPSAPGMFTERPSAVETPTIRIRNMSEDPLTLILTAEDGRTYRMMVLPFDTNSIQVPAGHYAASVVSANYHVHPAIGDATFRRRHEYEDAFVTRPWYGFDTPLHMGD